MVTLFFDGTCPLCVAEMEKLRRWDKRGTLQLVDIHQADFSQRYPQISRQYANRILHAQDLEGNIFLGLDATVVAWDSVGKGYWVKWLRWPVIRQISDIAYKLFARHRYLLSRLITGQSRCQQCKIK